MALSTATPQRMHYPSSGTELPRWNQDVSSAARSSGSYYTASVNPVQSRRESTASSGVSIVTREPRSRVSGTSTSTSSTSSRNTRRTR